MKKVMTEIEYEEQLKKDWEKEQNDIANRMLEDEVWRQIMLDREKRGECLCP